MEIPLLSDSEVLVVPFDQLPEDSEDVIQLLTKEKAQLHFWVTLAIEYYRCGLKRRDPF